MAVQLARSYGGSYNSRVNLRVVSNPNKLQESTSKAVYLASLDRARLNQQYWEDLLEQLRKSGGGGGGGSDKRFDKIAVSMMLTNFLNNKILQAMLRNFGGELFLVDSNKISNQTNNATQNISLNRIQNIGKMIFGFVTKIFSLIVSKDAPSGRLYAISNQLPILTGMLSFQLNKLKEILDDEFKEAIKKLDVKEKIKKVKTFILDLFKEFFAFN